MASWYEAVTDNRRDELKKKLHLHAALNYSKLSKAKRLKVGAIITMDDRVVSIGYNGMPSGSELPCEDIVLPKDFGEVPVGKDVINDYLVTKKELIHAEANAILFAAKHGIKTDGCHLTITHSPCFECAKMIIQCGISSVFYGDYYRDSEPIEFLKENGVKVDLS